MAEELPAQASCRDRSRSCGGFGALGGQGLINTCRFTPPAVQQGLLSTDCVLAIPWPCEGWDWGTDGKC